MAYLFFTLIKKNVYFMSKKKTEENSFFNELLSKQTKDTNFKLTFKCKNATQKKLVKTIKDKDITFCSGAAGTGKSYISLATALELLKKEPLYKKIVIIVPTIQSDIEIGFLKGTLDQKIAPHAYAHLYTMEKILTQSGNDGKEMLAQLQKENKVEIMCVSFLRGLTIDDSIVFITESQNLPTSAFKTLLTRIGENSKYIFDGDLDQIDNKEIRKNKGLCGLQYAINHLKDIDEVGVVEFSKDEIVRNPIITKILDAWLIFVV